MIRRFLKRRNILVVFCIISGTLLAISFPNNGFLAWIALIPLLFSLYYCTKIERFLLGFLTGFIFFGGQMYWELYVTPIAWICLTLLCSIYFSILCYFLHILLKKTKSWARLILIPSFWVIFEFFWSLTPLAFGWGILGYSQHYFLPLLQITRITGIYGVSFLIVFFNVSLFESLQLFKINNFKNFANLIEHLVRLFRKKRWLPYSLKYLFSAIILIILIIIYGFSPFLNNNPKNLFFKNLNEIKISLIQPNISQSIKISSYHKDYILETLEKLSIEALKNNPDLIVFPESAVPLLFLEEDESNTSYMWIKELLADIKTNLLTGIFTKDKEGNFHNSVIIFDKDGKIIDIYEKIHPIPFGEFIPARRFINNIGPLRFIYENSPLRILKEDVIAGKKFTIFPIFQGKIGSVICFESALGQIPQRLRHKGAQILFVVTNDGWFRDSIELEQHFYMGRVRAVENGVYFIQCANTGISGVFAPNGIILESTNKNEACTLSTSVYFIPGQTIYSKYGDVFSYLCFLIFLLWLFFKIPIFKR